MTTSEGALSGIKILSFAQLAQGNAGVEYRADLGADVIKIERPGKGAWERSWSGLDTYIKGESVFFLTLKSKREDVVEFAQEALKNEQDNDVRRRWVGYVGNKNSEGSVQFLENILLENNEDIGVKKIAAEIINDGGFNKFF